MKVVIFGNGFDLYHDMKTSYNDFRNFLMQESNQNDNELSDIFKRQNWDGDINDFVQVIDNIVDYENEQNEFITWSYFEDKFNDYVDKELHPNLRSETKVERFEKLERIHNIFVISFEYYLNQISSSNKSSSQLSVALNNADKIIVFNYTDTYLRYISKEKADEKVIHIHGNLKYNQTLLIGYEADSNATSVNAYLDREDLGYGNKSFFNKRYLTLRQSNQTLPDLLSSLSSFQGKVTELSIIGWSCGNSDNYFAHYIKDLLPTYPQSIYLNKENLNSLKPAKIIIYTREEDYKSVCKPFRQKILNSYRPFRITGGLEHATFEPVTIEKRLYKSKEKLERKNNHEIK